MHNGYNSQTDRFTNELPNELSKELEEAKNLGVKPISIDNLDEFEKMLKNTDQIKWAMLEDGTFVAMPKFVNGIELKHPVLTGGKDVISAGEGFIIGDRNNGFFGELNNNSGHYKPSIESVEKVKNTLGGLVKF